MIEQKHLDDLKEAADTLADVAGTLQDTYTAMHEAGYNAKRITSIAKRVEEAEGDLALLRHELEKYTQQAATEQQAKELGKNYGRLLQRLLDAADLLPSPDREKFITSTFLLEQQQLISRDGQLVLQWRPRLHPNLPPGPENQQTSTGIVLLLTNTATLITKEKA